MKPRQKGSLSSPSISYCIQANFRITEKERESKQLEKVKVKSLENVKVKETLVRREL